MEIYNCLSTFNNIIWKEVKLCIQIALGTVTITVAMLAKIAVAGSFGICFNYTAELFPTVIRNSVMGIVTMAARGAGMLAPEIILLVKTNYSLMWTFTYYVRDGVTLTF